VEYWESMGAFVDELRKDVSATWEMEEDVGGTVIVFMRRSGSGCVVGLGWN
jgi:hypothetical protein